MQGEDGAEVTTEEYGLFVLILSELLMDDGQA